MAYAHIAELVPVLQVAVGPVILISGVGLLLLTMTNRFGRIIDRSRILAAQRREGTPDDQRRADAQVAILWRRATLVRRAITLAGISVLLAAVLVIALFVAALAQLELGPIVIVLFTLCLAALVGSMVSFIQEINESLEALRLDLFGGSR